MNKRIPEPYPGYRIRWDERAEEEQSYLYFSEAQEMFRALRDCGKYLKVELFGVLSEEWTGEGDRLDPIDRWERA